MILGLDARKWSEEEINKLQREHDLFWSGRDKGDDGPNKVLGFLYWYGSKDRREWKLGVWHDNWPVGSRVEQRLQREYNTLKPESYICCADGRFKKGDWILTYRSSPAGKSLSNFEWLFVDFVEPISPDDHAYSKEWPNQAVQARRSRFIRPPFSIEGVDFQKAFARAVREYGVDKLHEREAVTVPPTFLNVLAEQIA